MALLAMMFEDQSLTSDLSSYLNVLGPGSGTIWTCGLVEIGVTWLE